jgi:DNA primase
VLLFDADQAGRNAAMRGIELAIQAGFDVNIVVLPQGEDPDSFVRTKGRDAFEQALEHRQSFIETKAQWFKEQGSFNDPTQLAAAVRSIVETVAHVPDAIKRAFFLQKLAERFHLSEQLLTMELEKIVKRNQSPRPATRERQNVRSDPPEEPPFEEPVLDERLPDVEVALLSSLLQQPVLVERVIAETEFDVELLTDPKIKQLVGYVLQQVEEGSALDLASLLKDYRTRQDYARVLISAAIDPNDLSGHWDEPESDSFKERVTTQARHAIIALKRGELERRRDRARQALATAQTEDEKVRWMREISQLGREYETLKIF